MQVTFPKCVASQNAWKWETQQAGGMTALMLFIECNDDSVANIRWDLMQPDQSLALFMPEETEEEIRRLWHWYWTKKDEAGVRRPAEANFCYADDFGCVPVLREDASAMAMKIREILVEGLGGNEQHLGSEPPELPAWNEGAEMAFGA